MKCPVAKKCGGCQLQNLNYAEQLSFKQVKVIKLLGRFHHVDEIIGMENPYHYRNKVQAAFCTDSRRNIISGVYQSSSHRIVSVDSCLIEDEKADEINLTIRKLLKNFKLTSYNEDTGKGFLRHTLIKHGFKSGQIMVVLVSGTAVFPSKRSFVNALREKQPEITTVVWNVNSAKTSLVLGSKFEVIYGDGKIEEELCSYKFRISPSAFYQINPVQTEVLYNKALEFADIKKTDIVIDAYCGTGTIGILASKNAKKVIGVELNGKAVADAKENARLNNVKNIRFIKADAGEFMLTAAKNNEKAQVVITDPPRTGCGKAFLSSLVSLSPERVVYVSCDPETLSRDLTFLTKNGYKVRKIQPVDMFPHTAHIECVVFLERVIK